MTSFKDYKIRDYTEEDINWIVETHGEIYAKEYGFDSTFPGYVSNPLNLFHESRNIGKECIWIAEKNNKNVGVIAIASVDDNTAQLRWFLLLESERGNGLGNYLMNTAVNYAKITNYKNIILWTVSILDAARYLYKKHGFNIDQEIQHSIWGKDLIEERWVLMLDNNDCPIL